MRSCLPGERRACYTPEQMPSGYLAPDTPLCGAKRSGTTETCKNQAGYRTPHHGRGPCYKHFGCTPAIVAKYITEEAMENVVKAGYRGSEVEIGPHEALLEEVRRTAGKVRYLNDQLDFDTPPDEQTLVVYERDLKWERSHLVTVCGVAARAGVEERAINLAETWGQELAAILGRIFQELQLSAEQKAEAPAIVARHLKLLESGTAA